MISYCALAILAVLLGANAQSGDPPCSKQMELEHRCMLNIETSPEAQMIKDRMKQVKKTCVPDYPEECHAQFEAGHECAIEVAKSADTDATFQAAKSQSQPAVDACFDKYPVDIKKGLMEIFMMGKPQMHHGGHKKHHGGHHKRHHNQTSSEGASGEKHSSESGEKHSGESGEQQASFESSSNETSASGERHHGGKHGGGKRHHCRAHRHHGHKNSTSSEMKSNETSGSQERRHRGGKGGKSSSGGKSGGKSGEHREMPQCRKTKEQKQCMKDEMTKLAKDSAFVDVINTLIHQKQKCKQIITWSCSPKCHKKQKCIFQATKPCRQAFMDKMKTCLAAKGFTLPPFMLKEHTQMFTTPMPDLTQS